MAEQTSELRFHSPDDLEIRTITLDALHTAYNARESLWPFGDTPFRDFSPVSRGYLAHSPVKHQLDMTHSGVGNLLVNAYRGLATGELGLYVASPSQVFDTDLPAPEDFAPVPDHENFVSHVRGIPVSISSNKRGEHQRVTVSAQAGRFAMLAVSYAHTPAGEEDGGHAEWTELAISTSRDISGAPGWLRKIIQDRTRTEVYLRTERLKGYNLQTVELAGIHTVSDSRGMGRPDKSTPDTVVVATAGRTANRLDQMAATLGKAVMKLPPARSATSKG